MKKLLPHELTALAIVGQLLSRWRTDPDAHTLTAKRAASTIDELFYFVSMAYGGKELGKAVDRMEGLDFSDLSGHGKVKVPFTVGLNEERRQALSQTLGWLAVIESSANDPKGTNVAQAATKGLERAIGHRSKRLLTQIKNDITFDLT